MYLQIIITQICLFIFTGILGSVNTNPLEIESVSSLPDRLMCYSNIHVHDDIDIIINNDLCRCCCCCCLLLLYYYSVLIVTLGKFCFLFIIIIITLVRANMLYYCTILVSIIIDCCY